MYIRNQSSPEYVVSASVTLLKGVTLAQQGPGDSVNVPTGRNDLQ